MASLNASVPLSRLTRELTMVVTITGTRAYKCRIWAAIKIMKFAAWVLGTKVQIELTGPQ